MGKKPQKFVYLGTIAEYQPSYEKRNIRATNKKRLDIIETEPKPKVQEHMSEILLVSYEGASLVLTRRKGKQKHDKIPQIIKGGITYSDKHMGAGELKIFRLVDRLEELPKRSLILLEEPEVNLHPEVHWRLGFYLMELCNRQMHQIIIATHSPTLFRVFPHQARIFLRRNQQVVEVEQDAEPLRVERELSGYVYTNKDLILVEDKVAKVFLERILFQFDRLLHEQVTIVNYGGKSQIREAVKQLAENSFRVIGVRDPEVGEDRTNKLLSLPGGKVIEYLLLESENRKRASSQIDRLEEAYSRAESKCVRYTGSDRCKESTASIE